MAKLLIVESPGKLKTLRKILGSDWILEASVGHTTELAHDGPSKLGFELKNGKVDARYVPRGDRGKQVLSKLRKAIKQADHVYLAMDPDREGEAIAWHLVDQLRPKSFSRVSYSQITESAVKAAIKSPRGLDYPLIHAQQARQCLDKLVGFEVSPLLWNSSGGKSAGRVQSATLHLVCERERERQQFKPEDYWTLHSHYKNGMIAQYEPKKNTAQDEIPKVKSAADAKRIEDEAKANLHKVASVDEREDRRSPLAPLITSTLQQTASVRLKFSPQKTMKVAQELYEGVNGKGLITYMRTDSVALSPEFIADARAWLQKNCPEAIGNGSTFKVASGAQGAHEAIRPTSVELTPQLAAKSLNAEQASLYKLIWERAVASQCKQAKLARTTVEITAGSTRWVARGLRVLDAGYLRFWRNIEDEKELPALTIGQVIELDKIKTDKKTTQPPPRYSEAKLVQLMEKLGIGRPSTYASIVATLKDRGYVVLDKESLAPTPLGLSTDEVLMKAMPDLVDVKFTAKMEQSLDKIAENKLGWEKFLCDWNQNFFTSALIQARSILKTFNVPKFTAPSVVARTSRGTGFSSSGGGKQTFNAKTFRKKAAGKKAGRKRAPKFGSVKQSDSPSCTEGHGPMAPLVSKKGDLYYKCQISSCKSWKWGGK